MKKYGKPIVLFAKMQFLSAKSEKILVQIECKFHAVKCILHLVAKCIEISAKGCCIVHTTFLTHKILHILVFFFCISFYLNTRLK